MNPFEKIERILIVRGIASAAFGVLVLVRPGASMAALVFLYGFYALIDGGLLLGFAARNEEPKAPFIVRGLISVAAGVLTFVYPGITAVSLYIVISAWAIASGIAELGTAISLRKEASVGGLALSGLLSIACGIVLLALPAAGVIALVSVIAVYAITNGIVLILAGIRLHHFIQRPKAA